MAVHVLPRSHTHAPQQVAIPPAVLLLTLIAPAVDLLGQVQSNISLLSAGTVASGLGVVAIVVMWLRFPRTDWLAAACFAALASLVMRVVGADVAPLLSLLAVVALGLGGAFAGSELSSEVA
jgi:hypothetical protein